MGLKKIIDHKGIGCVNFFFSMKKLFLWIKCFKKINEKCFKKFRKGLFKKLKCLKWLVLFNFMKVLFKNI